MGQQGRARGGLHYYGRFYPTALQPLLRRINAYILRWARKTVREQDRTVTNLLLLLGRHGVHVSRCDCTHVLLGNQQELVLLDGWHGPEGCFRT